MSEKVTFKYFEGRDVEQFTFYRIPKQLFTVSFFKSLSSAMQANLYVQARGENNHHLAEGVFKAFARCLKQAVRRNVFSYDLPSSKGLL